MGQNVIGQNIDAVSKQCVTKLDCYFSLVLPNVTLQNKTVGVVSEQCTLLNGEGYLTVFVIKRYSE
jgi:hypothetical protein